MCRTRPLHGRPSFRTGRLRSIFQAADRLAADERLRQIVAKYEETAPRLARWMEENVPEGLTALDLPTAHRRRLRTTNMVERLNREIRRRTAVAALFPNEASLLRLATAIVAEIADEWETGRVYLNVENAD